MATYKQIRADVRANYGKTRYIQNCFIAHVKELNGLAPRPAHNRQSLDVRMKPCPDDVRPLIEAAMRRFQMF